MMLREVKARLRSRNNQQGKEETGKEETKDQGQEFSFTCSHQSFLPAWPTEAVASLSQRRK